MHRRLPVAALAVLAAVAVAVAAGAAIAATASSKATVKQVAIATPAKPNDYGWNQQGYNAAKAAAASVGAKFVAQTNIGYDKTETVLRQLAQGGASFIIAHASGFDPIAVRIGEQYKVPIMTYDYPTNLKKGYVSNITTSSQQGAYLAGILAAKMSKTKHVGVVISATDPNWYKMSGGFVAGVRSVSPKMKISFATISPTGYDDSAGGKRVVTQVIATGADVIFGMGDDASFGYLQGIETAKAGHKVWYIGDIGNMGPIDKHHVLLSSVMWFYTKTYEQAISDIKAGTYGTHGYNLTLANGGIGLLKTKYIPASVWSQIQKAQAKIKSGTLKVPLTTKASQVQALINKK
ncbi:MAG TPA: BMP family ABC transporter substrate-binding protein [Gaiellaceae bacterium]|nr:BMP family ABC transporter substrate-binding protein [Gaiellaceae bacterium]